MPCECSLVASNQGDNPTMKYKITYYKNGKAIVVKFATLSAAKQAAHDLFECIGIVAGIESIA